MGNVGRGHDVAGGGPPLEQRAVEVGGDVVPVAEHHQRVRAVLPIGRCVGGGASPLVPVAGYQNWVGKRPGRCAGEAAVGRRAARRVDERQRAGADGVGAPDVGWPTARRRGRRRGARWAAVSGAAVGVGAVPRWWCVELVDDDAAMAAARDGVRRRRSRRRARSPRHGPDHDQDDDGADHHGRPPAATFGVASRRTRGGHA